MNTEFSPTDSIKCLFYARVCAGAGAKRPWSVSLGSCSLTKWMNDRTVVQKCREGTDGGVERRIEEVCKEQMMFHPHLFSAAR